MISSMSMEPVVPLHRNTPSSLNAINSGNIDAVSTNSLSTSLRHNSPPSPPASGANKRKQPHRAFHADLQQAQMDNDSCSPENMADEQGRPASNKSCSTILRSSSIHPTAAAAPTNNGGGHASVENFLEAQKAFQKLTSQLSGFDQRNTFHLNTLSPFLAALQQQQALQHQLFNASAASFAANGREVGREGSTASSSRVSERLEEDEEESETCLGAVGVEPEDLSLCKQRKLEVDECATAASNWSYEEQFKQLYELSDDPKRKEWLDDWLSFMHRIGKPVTRIPIMAKQVLDLYELYRLVVQHGGLVEIINKKLWREITKGLNLPNSITSAAFTLRTQYQKYLYDYECHHENLSCLSDLQAAIEGNRRDGRRNHHSSCTPNPPSSMANNVITSSLLHSHHSTTAVDSTNSGSTASAFPYPLINPHSMAAALFGKHLTAFNHKDESMDLNALNQQISAQHSQQALATAAGLEAAQQRQFELFQKAAIDAVAGSARQVNLTNNNHSGRNSTSSFDSDTFALTAKKLRMDNCNTVSSQPVPDIASAAHLNNIDQLFKDSSSTHMKLTNARAPSGENSMVVSMEINGVMYQGMLFAIQSSSSANTSPPSLNIHSLHNGLLGMEQSNQAENTTNNGNAETDYLEGEI